MISCLLLSKIQSKAMTQAQHQQPQPKKKGTAAGASAPLLPESNSSENETGGASTSGAVFNLSTTMVGAGIMSIPATIKVLGIVPGFVVILIVALLVDVTVEFMLKYTQHSAKSDTYGGLVAESFGPLGSAAVQLCVLITNLGCLVIYLIIIGDVLSGTQSGGTLHLGVLQEWFGIHWWTSRAYALLFIVLFLMLPLVLLPRVDSLRHSSAVSIFLAMVFVAISSAMAIYALWEGQTQTPRLFPDFGNHVTVLDLFTTIPVIVTSFGFHFNVHPIRAELGKPSDMKSAVSISLAICVAIYFSIGFFGYLLFGESIMADLLVNFDQNSNSPAGRILNDIVRLSYAIHLVLVFPLINFGLRANIDELVFAKRPVFVSENTKFVSLTLVLLSLSYIMAVAIPDIWYLFQFMGSTTVVCLSFIFPGAIVLRDVHGIATTRDKVMAVLMIVLAVVTSSIAISMNFYHL